MKGKYVVRYSRYDSVTYNFNDNSKRHEHSNFGEIVIVHNGTEESCINFVKVKALEATLEAVDNLFGGKTEICLNDRGNYSLDIIDSDYEKEGDVRIFRDDSYVVEKFEPWMK